MPFDFQFQIEWEYGERRGKDVLANFVLHRFSNAIGNWTPAFRMIADDILEYAVERQFESEGSAGGESWQALAPSTLARIGRDQEHAFILYRSGMLAKSFRKDEPMHHQEIEPKRMAWGSDVPYALFHQTGTGKGFSKSRVTTGKGTGRGMPMRKVLVITPETRAQIESTLLGRGAQIARQIGFAVTGDRGLSALEARQIGEAMLGD